jgi:hypothetical protein
MSSAREAYRKARGDGSGLTNGSAPFNGRILSGRDFLATFIPPDYIIDGIVQRGWLYACTSLTAHGKTAVWLYMGCMVAGHRYIGNSIEVTGGDVIILAGENAADLCGRMHAMCQEYHLDDTKLPHVLPVGFPLSKETAEKLKDEIDGLGLNLVLIIIDTGPAYFPGDDEIDNVQMGNYGRTQRILTECRGRPAVVALTHPVKNAARDNLVPRGGGGYLNELDGNLTLWSDAIGESTTLHHQRKLRGTDFAPLTFSLRQVTMDHLRDAKGRPIVSIVAAPQTPEAADNAKAQTISDQNAVLYWLNKQPGISIRGIAKEAGWVSDTEAKVPNTAKVHRCLQALKGDKLVRLYRGKWVITDAGKQELKA